MLFLHQLVFQRRRVNFSVLVLSILLATVSLLLCSFIIYSILFSHRSQLLNITSTESLTVDREQRKKAEIEVNASYLLTLLITKRKVCVLEASTDRLESSKHEFLVEHIESARLLSYQNLSHNGAPVHPLQFQRLARSLGIDTDCHVIIYDRGEMIWATYAHWIFTLFGHEKVSILAGGFERWKVMQKTSPQYRTVSGLGTFVQRMGNFQATWKKEVICTFDDVITNSELKTYSLEYDGYGKGAIFGHIRSAVNIPIDTVYSWTQQKWKDNRELEKIFTEHGIERSQPVIVYCSTSIRASMIWFALQKAGYSAAIYFGSWPEWLIKAPDYLKIISDKILKTET
ncbi:unnamed protein product [Enterobius vermicularis]|uniref:Rhodanese domain-containing protein n=1 Tax=Enterobius vermicularis TaxID=51028 RepID=A0A3P6H6B7_ENTVE|nr:unnamed protein product [Enterobius vermicularis]